MKNVRIVTRESSIVCTLAIAVSKKWLVYHDGKLVAIHEKTVYYRRANASHLLRDWMVISTWDNKAGRLIVLTQKDL